MLKIKKQLLNKTRKFHTIRLISNELKKKDIINFKKKKAKFNYQNERPKNLLSFLKTH